MGGLRKSLPLVYACFLVGGSALAALPLVTAGFYSKDAILWQVQASGQSALLWAGLGGAFLTSLYTFRLIFIAFHGKEQTQAHAGQGLAHHLPQMCIRDSPSPRYRLPGRRAGTPPPPGTSSRTRWVATCVPGIPVAACWSRAKATWAGLAPSRPPSSPPHPCRW